MTLVAADGQAVEPVEVDEFRFGVAETYDVLVTPKAHHAYTIAAESIDRTGFALATLAPEMGMRGEQPEQRPMSLLTMADMGMAHDMDHSSHDMSMNEMDHSEHHMDHSQHGMAMMDHSMHDVSSNPTHAPVEEFETGVAGSGWANAHTPEGQKALSYEDLRYHGEQTDLREAEREIIVRLGGNMERYIWTLNGKKFPDARPIELQYGERVRLTFINDTMMAHPMHLHGMFMQLENGQPMEKLPNKHTLIVAPGDTYSVLLTADEAGEWAFHCHLLYHMMSGMMNKVVVATLDENSEKPEAHHAH
jgi:FtsP/CotA-like multicopper oxidase with cupredoxin domain